MIFLYKMRLVLGNKEYEMHSCFHCLHLDLRGERKTIAILSPRCGSEDTRPHSSIPAKTETSNLPISHHPPYLRTSRRCPTQASSCPNADLLRARCQSSSTTSGALTSLLLRQLSRKSYRNPFALPNILPESSLMLDSTLSTHPLMADPPSSHLTPAPLFHIYDFIERTRCNLGGISVAKLSANEKDALENWNDCVGRCDMARLMLDDKTGKAAELLGGKVDLGEKVREAVLRAAVVAGNVGSAVDVRVGRISTNVTGKHKNT